MAAVRVSRGDLAEGQQFYTDAGTLVRGKYLFFKELGSRKFIVFQRFKGKVNLHLRNYILDEEEFVYIPTKRGVILNKQQTRDLLNAMPELTRVVKHVSKHFLLNFLFLPLLIGCLSERSTMLSYLMYI